jgi:putative membrane protein
VASVRRSRSWPVERWIWLKISQSVNDGRCARALHNALSSRDRVNAGRGALEMLNPLLEETMTHFILRRLALVALPALVACSGSDPSQTGDLTQSDHGAACPGYGLCTDAGHPPVPSPAGDASPTADAGTAGDADVDTFYSDGQIFAILIAANAGEVAQGAQAELKTVDARVKDFGHRMVVEHGDALHAETELAIKLGIVPLGSDVSHALEQETAQTLAHRAPLDCDTFDRAYADGQVTAHQKVLALLDTKLIPSAQAPSLVSHLADVRAHVEAHLAAAVQLQAAIHAK